MTHTPTPWIVKEKQKGRFYRIMSEDNKSIADVWLGNDGDQSQPVKQDAEHIVKCVNAHDDLVNALKGILPLKGACPDGIWDNEWKAIENILNQLENVKKD